MGAHDGEISLTLGWVGRFQDRNWAAQREEPTVDAVAQLFYALRLLYAESIEETLGAADQRRRGGTTAPPRDRNYEAWARVLKRASTSVDGGPLRDWPTRLPMPRIPPESDLRLESLGMASPLEIVLVIPGAVLVPGGLAILWKFGRAIEQAWNAPQRVRLEGLELDRKIIEAELERDIARKRSRDLRRGGFELLDGSVRPPDDHDELSS